MPPDQPDRSRSRAILIGVSAYDDDRLTPLPAARNSVEALAAVLRDPLRGGWPDDRVTTMIDPVNGGRTATRLRELASDVDDALLLYYVGHGLLTPRGTLCLTVTDTLADTPEFTGIVYDWVGDAIRGSPAAVKATVLDCCFAGRVIEALAGPQTVADTAAISGSYTLTATRRTETAHVPRLAAQATATTSFTGELVALLREGVPGGARYLRFGDLFPLLTQRLREQGLPLPNQRGTNDADRFVVAVNVAAEAAQVAEPVGADARPEVPSPVLTPSSPRIEPWPLLRRLPKPPPRSSPPHHLRYDRPGAAGPLRTAIAANRTSFATALVAVLLAVGAVVYSILAGGDPGGGSGEQPEPLPPEQVHVWVGSTAEHADAAEAVTGRLAGAGYLTDAPDVVAYPGRTTVRYVTGFQPEAEEVAQALGLSDDTVARLADVPAIDARGAEVVVLLAAPIDP